ncbi:hypothetical protein [Dysgonomonas sp. 520]|uniref:hypothetical protein n=1 Tax=Dysgonomonas sp. 520 TaxID=2302931 RepID=UPI0013D5E7FD|nr:hypothetical protein [Dysgonomonas sp. 520]NDW11057.1 hypothetical protein [Dysgonomonas sp. 520]
MAYKKSVIKEPKNVLVFDNTRTLIAIIRSLRSAALFIQGNQQAISFCCTGKHIKSGGYYFRHKHSDVEIKVDDLNRLKLEDYDKACGITRTYHTKRDLDSEWSKRLSGKSSFNDD